MESFARQLERQGQFSPAATQDESRTTSVSPIPVSTPTLPMRPAAPSPTADVQVQESQHLKRLFRGEFEAEACQNGLLLLAEIRQEVESHRDVSVLHSLLETAATNWIIRAQSHFNKQRQLELELAQPGCSSIGERAARARAAGGSAGTAGD